MEWIPLIPSPGPFLADELQAKNDEVRLEPCYADHADQDIQADQEVTDRTVEWQDAEGQDSDYSHHDFRDAGDGIECEFHSLLPLSDVYRGLPSYGQSSRSIPITLMYVCFRPLYHGEYQVSRKGAADIQLLLTNLEAGKMYRQENTLA